MVYIDPRMPLPDHTKLNYDECYAKVVLEEFFPEKFSGLLLDDRPDLRCPNTRHGIEVTSVLPQEEQEALRIGSTIPYVDAVQRLKKIKYLKNKGYNYTDYGMFHFVCETSWCGLEPPPLEKTPCKLLLDGFESKVRKLNSGKYAELERYDLFVYSELSIEEWMYAELMEKLVSKNVGEKQYSNIYLLALDGLFVFNLTLQKLEIHETGKRLWGLSKRARKMVEEGEQP